MKNTRGIFFFLMMWGFGLGLSAQTVQLSDIVTPGPDAGIQQYYELEVDMDQVRSQLKDAPPLGTEQPGRQIQLPTADGQWHTFELWDAPIMMDGLAKRFPMIKNLKGRAIDNPRLGIRLNYGPRGLFAVMHDDKDKSYIQTPGLYADKHRLYFSKHTYSNWTCEVDETNLAPGGKPATSPKSNNCTELGDQLFTYRIVVATTGEFWNLNDTGNGLPDVLQALNDRLADMLIPYERDLSMTFQLVDSNEIVMYEDPNTDPFSDPTNTVISLNEAESTIESNFADSLYDIGHGYHEITCGGSCGWAGRAGVAVACRDGDKARGYTFQPNDISTNTVFSHEFGHQLSCWHTNYGCNNTGCHRVEPGQGLTIMSTSAGCSSADNYASRVDFFHARSIEAILDYTLNGLFNSNNNSCDQFTITGWSKCVDESPSGNTPPVAEANPNALNLNIPISTPFFLEGAASDPDDDPWTANWVDYNSDPNNSVIPDNAGTSMTAPLFRWFQPSTDVIRYFPQLSSILDGNNTTGTGEVLPSVGRDMDFRFVVRDNATLSGAPSGALACDELTVMVDGGSGPFEVTSQNSPVAWVHGTTQTITWSVNNTDQAPISATNVDILLSTDGGQNFNMTLASNVANDGSHDITVPIVSTSTGRIKVEPTGDYIFFDINDADIDIGECPANGESIFPASTLVRDEGDPDLLISAQTYGAPFSVSDALVSDDLIANLAVEDNNMMTCTAFGNDPYHKVYPIQATQSGSYTFTKSGSITPFVMNIYDPNFVPSTVCNNWIASSGNFTGSGITISSTVSSTLDSLQDYELTFNGFNGGNTGSFSISVSGPGDVFLPGAPIGNLSYEYVTVNISSGNIEQIASSPDLRTFSPGMYEIHGLHYLSSIDIQTYVNGPFSTLQQDITNGTICGDLSGNTRDIEVQQLLPLDFLHFTVDRVKAGAHLQWTIADAINVSHFEVERFDDKRGQFVYIADQAFQEGTTTYEDIDPHIQSGQRYLYRIRSVDMDGFTQLSPIRWIQTPHDEDFTVFPNPTRDFFRIQGPVEDIQEVRIYDRVGRTVLHEQSPSDNRISTQNWTAGLYQVEIFTAERSLRLPLLVQ